MSQTRRRSMKLKVCTYQNPGGDEYHRVTIGTRLLRAAGLRFIKAVRVHVEPEKITLTPVYSDEQERP